MKLRTLIPTAILLFSLFTLLAGHLYISTVNTAEVDYIIENLRRELILRAALIEDALNSENPRVARGYLKGFTTDPDIRIARIIDENGVVLLSTHPSEEGSNIDRLVQSTDIESHLQHTISSLTNKIEYDLHGDLIEMTYRVNLIGSEVSLRPNVTGILAVEKSTERFSAIARNKETLFALIISGTLLLLSVLLWLLLTRLVTRPLVYLRRITHNIAAGHFDEQIRLPFHNEISALGDDITSMATTLRENREALSNSLQRLHLSQHYAAIGTWEWDMVSGVVTWSDEVYELFEQDRAHYHPTFENYLALIPDEDRPVLEQKLQTALTTNQPYEVRHRLHTASGTKWLLGRGNSERDASGKPIRMLGTVMDITRDVEYENQIKRSYAELQYQTQALNIHSIVSISDRNGAITYANDKFESISGYRLAELVGKTHRVISSGYHDRAFWQQMWATISAGKVWQGDIRNRKRNGDYYWVTTTIVPHLDKNGEPDRYTSVRTDITAIKEIQATLEHEHELLRTLAAINSAYLDNSQPKLVFDSILLTYLQYTQCELGLIAQVEFNGTTALPVVNVLSLYDIAWTDADRHIYANLLQSGYHLSADNSLVRETLRSHSPFHANQITTQRLAEVVVSRNTGLRNFASLPLHHGNQLIGVLCLVNRQQPFSDDYLEGLSKLNTATANILHEIDLETHNRRLVRALNTSGSEVFVINAANLRIHDVNDTVVDSSGYDRAQLLQMEISQLIPQLNEGLYDEFKHLDTHKSVLSMEGEHRRKDGSSFPIEGRVQYLFNETPNKIVAIVQDISERRQAEERQLELKHQLLQSQKMEALGHLTGGIAHDFNNMLAAILGYSELAHELLGQEGADRAKLQQYLQQVISASSRARDLITQMLAFSRTRLDSEVSAAAIKPVLKEVTGLLRSSLPATIELETQFGPELPDAQIQPVQLHQLIMNLCINARDAITDKGHIKINVARSQGAHICRSCHSPFQGDYIVISVEDDGQGIAPEVLDRVFEPFFTTKEVGKGTGMGLAVVHGIVHANQGHLELQSTAGRGTTFRIYLPVASTQAEQVSATTFLTHPKRLEALHILIVDDDNSVALYMKELLEFNHITADVYNDSEVAMAQLRAEPNRYQVVITDMTMPRLTGIEVARQVGEVNPTIPVILCSGYNEVVNKENATHFGIRAYLSKPINAQQLLDSIDRVSRG